MSLEPVSRLSPLDFLHQRRPGQSPVDAEPVGDWRHWRCECDSAGVIWLGLDREDASVNTLSEAVLDELNELLGVLEQRQLQGLVLYSLKDSGFCAGADIAMFRGLTTADVAMQKLRQGHGVVDRLEALPCRRVALLHGVCLGGGLEIALACDFRIALDSARLGFPEVQLGLHPGLGGTFRSVELLGPLPALQLMLQGRALNARRAKRLGLVDAVTAERHAREAVAAALRGEVNGYARGWLTRVQALAPVRPLIAHLLRREVAKKVSREHYPAPFDLIDVWRQQGADRHNLQPSEMQSFANLVTSKAGQNLVRVYFLREALKHQIHRKSRGKVAHLHVIGAGAMGGDIAAWSALRGLSVTLSDREPQMIANALQRAAKLADRKRLSVADKRAFLDRLIPDPGGDGIGLSDLIIEAVPERLDIKRQVYSSVVERMRPEAILATNTSSIPLQTLCEELPIADRFIGLHFFNPVAQMLLVEVVQHDRVSASTRDMATAFVGAIDRLPVPVASIPGFLVNRVLTPYLLEAMLMLDEGVSAATVDRAAEQFGMPMGPVELADRIGLDICLSVADMLRDDFDPPLPEVPASIRKLVEDGKLGSKSGAGIYDWKHSRPQKGKPGSISEEQTDRLILPLLNTCMECLRRGVVEDAEVLDAALIFGTGFAPFTGGPLNYARSLGRETLTARFDALAGRFGERFARDEGWEDFGG